MSDIDNANPAARWSEVDVNNAAPAPDGFPQVSGQDVWVDVPANGRAIMGAIKRFWDRINGTITTTGTAPQYVYTPSNTAFPLAYVQGETYTFKANFTSTGGDELNVNALGALPLYKPTLSGLVPIAAGDIQAGQIVQAIYDSALNGGSGGFQITGGVGLDASMMGVVGTVRGLTCSNSGGIATSAWTAKEIVAETSLGGIAYKGANVTLSFNGSTTGAGGMDSGSMPTSADLSVYAIYNPSTNTWNTLGCLGSTSNGPVYTGANMPTGYTASTLIFVGVTNGSGQFQAFEQRDRTVWIASTGVLTNGVSPGISSFSLASCVPVAATAAAGNFSTGGAGGASLQATGGGNVGYQWIGSNSQMQVNFGLIPMVAAQTLFYSSSVIFSVGIDSYQF